MNARRLAMPALGVVALLAVLAVLGGGPEPYEVKFQLTTANGLREGSPVKVGGVEIGTVSELKLGRDDLPVAVAELDPDEEGARVGRGASAEITTTNLLGSKVLTLEPGEGKRPSGAVVPRSRLSTPVDIDQVLNVLDADTRTRLQILIHEAGVAMTGRRVDFNEALDLLPQDLEAGTELLNEVVADNRGLRRTVGQAGRFVGRIARERAQLSRFVDDAGQTMSAVAEKRERLRETLARAPGTLTTLQRFLSDLETTTEPLGPASRAITATAPSLTATLAELRPFQRAADPALRRAVAVAPPLTRLAAGATPVIRRANPTLRSLARFARTAAPLSQTLDVSIDDTAGVLEGWARAIQNRDGVGHLFRGKATFSGEFFRALVNAPNPGAGARRGANRSDGDDGPARPEAAQQLPQTAPGPRGPSADRPLDILDAITDGTGTPGRADPRPGDGADTPALLLDYLLGP